MIYVYALISQGIVVNMIVAEPSFITTLLPNYQANTKYPNDGILQFDPTKPYPSPDMEYQGNNEYQDQNGNMWNYVPLSVVTS